MKFWVLSILLLLSAAQLHAIPITGGQILFPGSPGASYTLIGPNFSVTGTLVPDAPGPCWPSFCVADDPISTRVFIDSDTTGALHGTVNGVFYPFLTLGNARTGPLGGFVIDAGPISLMTDQLVYTAAFRLEGDLFLDTGPGTECVLCGPPVPGDPSGLPTALPATGFGQLRFQLREDVDHPGTFVLERATYDFQVPEPSTLAMLAVSLACYALSRKLRVN